MLSQPPQRPAKLPARQIAAVLRYHRGMVWLLIVRVAVGLAFIFGLVTNSFQPSAGLVAPGLLALVVVLTHTYLVFLAANAAFGITLTVIPFVGPLLSFMLSGDFQDLLRQAGITVGLLGAKASQLQLWETKAWQEQVLDPSPPGKL
jgi:hypothetical protein